MNLQRSSPRPLREALLRAEAMESAAMSMPVECWKTEARVMVKSPEPEYASMRYLMGEAAAAVEDDDEEAGGRMRSLIYEVNLGRIELLFWKKEPAGLVKMWSPIYSVVVALESVSQDLTSTKPSPSVRTV